MRRTAAQTHDHVLRVASELFYWDGIQAVGVERIIAVFEAVADHVDHADFRGCACTMTLAEFLDAGVEAHRAAVASKRWVREQFWALAAELASPGHRSDTDDLADDLVLVPEGMLASAQALGPEGPARRSARPAATITSPPR